MSKPSGSSDAGDTPSGPSRGSRPESPSASPSPAWTEALEALMAVPEGTLRRDLPGDPPGVFDAVRRDSQAYALAQARCRDRTGAAAALKAAAAGFSGAGPAEDERRTG